MPFVRMTLPTLLVFSAVVLLCCGFPGQSDKEEAEEGMGKQNSLTSEATSDPWKRLVLIHSCSVLAEWCHPLQYCCQGFGCVYETYFPPSGRCWYKRS